MNKVSISHPTAILQGEISLEGSKSISNRALVIQALCSSSFALGNIANCQDTEVLMNALNNPDKLVHQMRLAGTASRFLLAYFATRGGTQILEAEEALKNRPVAPLIEALKSIGCSIQSIEGNDSFPLRIFPFEAQAKEEIYIKDNVSSQFITALLLVAPTLPKGLKIHLPEGQVSKPYIDMTLQMMDYFGVEVEKTKFGYVVPPQNYKAKDLIIEGDWSSASYYVGMAALSKKANICLKGLVQNSWQGDASVVEIGTVLGVQFFWNESGLNLIKSENDDQKKNFLELDFSDTPDLFQTMAVACAGLNINGVFSGLETLVYKETNRIKALQTELVKFQVFLNKMPEKMSKKSGKTIYFLEGKYVHLEDSKTLETYMDHRMAMSLAMLGVLGKMVINNPEVVIKSYPKFWNDLVRLGFEVFYSE
ncbi:MAG: 3-phosphoshikimate 1-carboxyvinyltransferase [Saprospiraceae bacterium]